MRSSWKHAILRHFLYPLQTKDGWDKQKLLRETGLEQITVQAREETRPLTSQARITLMLVTIAAFLDVLDFSIVQVALPTIRTELVVPYAESQWVIGAYGLTMAGFLMLSGRAGDLYGQKKLFIIGITVFTAASLTGGFAPSLLSLVVSRAVQGVGAAITSATALAILAATFPEGHARNRAFGILISVLSAGFAAGAVAGGILTSALGWRSVMFVNVPIGVVAVFLSRKYLVESGGGAGDRRLDLPGALSVTGGTALFVYAFSNSAEVGLSSLLTLLPLGLSAVMLAGFFLIEYRSPAPLMPLGFLRRGAILSANALGLIVAGTAVGPLFLLTSFLQDILGYSPLYAALGFLPPTLVFFMVGGWGASWLLDRFAMKPVLVVSMVLVVVGSGLLTQISIAGGYWGLLPGLLLWSLGASIGFPALTIAALAGTKHGEEGLASGLINTSERVGGPLGLAIILTVASAMTPKLTGVVGSSAAIVVGIQYAFAAATILNGIGLVIALLIGKGKGPIVEPLV